MDLPKRWERIDDDERLSERALASWSGWGARKTQTRCSGSGGPAPHRALPASVGPLPPPGDGGTILGLNVVQERQRAREEARAKELEQKEEKPKAREKKEKEELP